MKILSISEAIKAGLNYKQWVSQLPDDAHKRQYASQRQGKLWFNAIKKNLLKK